MMRGCVCRWCGEDVTRADERYEAMDGRAVHAECMETPLPLTEPDKQVLAQVGLEARAERMGYEHRREVEMDAEWGEEL